MKTAAVVFLYHYGKREINNIMSYGKYVDIVYAYDNSDKIDAKMVEYLCQIPNVEYLGGDGNRGIAYAINTAMQKALSDDVEWLFTFDQDSSLRLSEMEKYIQFLLEIQEDGQIAVVCPVAKKSLQADKKGKIIDLDIFRQSGAAHRVKIMALLGGYDERLFIDSVDYDYGLKAKKAGYRILENRNIQLMHSKYDWKLEKGYDFRKYPPVRYYYITRNILYTMGKYKDNEDFCRFQRRFLWEKLCDALKISCMEKNMIYIKACFWGSLDFYNNRMGKCRYKL